MTVYSDRYGRAVEHETAEAGEIFRVAGVAELVLPPGATWADARGRIEALAPAEAELEADPVPASVPAWKAKIALSRVGLLAAAEAAIAAAGPEARIAFAEAPEWSRSGALLAYVAAELGLEASAVDDLFRAADGIAV